MYSKLKKISASPLTQNFFLLGGVQSVTLLIPLLLTPYLTLTVGLFNFGKIVFSQSIANILAILIDYGFNLSATRSIAINKHNGDTLNDIYTVTFACKISLAAVALLILFLLFLVPSMYADKTVLLFSFTICLGQMATPSWAFQGIEKLKTYSLINVSFKILYILSVFVLVKRPSQYIYANLLLGICGIGTGVVSIIFLHKKYNFRFVSVKFQTIVTTLKDSFHYFISIFSINIYSYLNSAVLLFFTDYASVGLYGILEKILQISKQVLVIYSQVIHPAACRIADRDYGAYKIFLKKAYLPFLAAFTIFCATLFLFTPYILHFFNAPDVSKASYLMHFILFALLITCLNIPAYITLLALHFPKSYSTVLLSSALASVALNILLTYLFGLTGCIVNILITEFLIMTGLHLMLQLRHKQYALFN